MASLCYSAKIFPDRQKRLQVLTNKFLRHTALTFGNVTCNSVQYKRPLRAKLGKIFSHFSLVCLFFYYYNQNMCNWDYISHLKKNLWLEYNILIIKVYTAKQNCISKSAKHSKMLDCKKRGAYKMYSITDDRG